MDQVICCCCCILCNANFTCADKQKVYTIWLKDQYFECCDALCTLICHENRSVQVATASSFCLTYILQSYSRLGQVPQKRTFRLMKDETVSIN